MTVAIIIVICVLVLAVVAAALGSRIRGAGRAGGIPVAEQHDRLPAQVAEFHVRGADARVHFEVPLPAGEIDDVLSEVLVREAIEVVREKRHTLPISEVHRVVALGRRGDQWVEVGSVGLDTPGELPPPVPPALLPHAARSGFDAFERISDLPQHAPGLAGGRVDEELPPLAAELRMPAGADAGLRSLGIDPGAADPGDLVIGLMRLSGYRVTPGASEGATIATRAGQRVLVRTVPHRPSEHPELSEDAVRRFIVEFVESGCDRGLLVTEKFSPFAVYERERREPRVRFITRERLQQFVDALALG